MKRDPESLLGTDDGQAYRRFVDWSVGDGFDLAIIKMTAPVDRNALIAWTKEQVPEARDIDVRNVGKGREHLWELLRAAREQGATMLMLYGLEEADARQYIIAQLNVQRDELVKAFAIPWVLFVHPAVYPMLVDKAPDFVDFAGLWLDELPAEVEAISTIAIPSPNLEVVAQSSDESTGETDLLANAAKAIRLSQLDHARDLLAQYDFAHPEMPEEHPDGALARCLRAFVDNRHRDAMALLRDKLLPTFDQLAHERVDTMGYIVDILRLRGEWDEALHIARDYLLPSCERRGDAREGAITRGRIADILYERGELDEALRIRREEELPVYERIHDERSRALTLGRIADILQLRGEVDEALRIRREEELPVYERLGDVRARAITLGQIADVMEARGDLDEALRIRREEELPVYERLGDIRARAVVLGQIADVLTARGEIDEALRIRREEELPVYERLGDVSARAMTFGRIADICRMRGELDKALQIYRDDVLSVFERLGDVRALLFVRPRLAVTLINRGYPEDVPEIIDQLAQSLTVARNLHAPVVEPIESIVRQIGLDPNAPPFTTSGPPQS